MPVIDEHIEKFLEGSSDLLKDGDFIGLYDKAHIRHISIGVLTQYLLEAGINPLEYMDSIPEDYLASSSIKTVQIPSCIKSIGSSAFAYSSLTSITIPDSVTQLGSEIFQKSCVEHISLGKNVIEVPENMAAWCSSLREVVIPEGVRTIGEGAFEHCVNLVEVLIPDSVSYIAESAFNNCTNLTKIDIAQSSTLPRFYRSPIKQLTISNKITEFPYKLDMTSTLEEVTFKGTRAEWESLMQEHTPIKEITTHCLDGDIIWKPLSLESLSDTNEIAEDAFEDRLDLHKITIPSNIKKIRSMAFGDCSNLTSVNLNRVEVIEYAAFRGTAISEVVIPSTVTGLSSNAFDDQNLSKITLESNSALPALNLTAYKKLREIVVLSPVELTIAGLKKCQLTIVPGTKLLFKRSNWKGIQNITFRGSLQEWGDVEKNLTTHPQETIPVSCLDGNTTMTPVQDESAGGQIYTLSQDSKAITARKRAPFWGETAPMGDVTGRFYWTSADDVRNFADKYGLTGVVVGKSLKTRNELVPYVKLPEDNIYIMARFADKWNK